MALEQVPDLVLSDVMMQRMDGYQFCRELKLNENTSHIPVILLTARASTESKIEGLETGADDFITKPFDSMELMVRVKNLIDQRKRWREQFITEMAMSQVQLYRKLKALLNLSANEFIRSLRLNYAARLIGKKAGNIAQVSYAVGFNNPSYFAECFKKQFGITPREFAKQ
jgi:DNA-binding response OmpR family regulator